MFLILTGPAGGVTFDQIARDGIVFDFAPDDIEPLDNLRWNRWILIEQTAWLRKELNPNAQLRLFRITRNLGYPNVYSKYFIKKNLSVQEVENITSAFFNGRLKLIPMIGEESTYDYDGTDFEYRMITKMLNSSKK